VIERVSQSLAGRTALLTLLPFSYDEVYGSERVDLSTVLLTGFYPRIHDRQLDPSEALGYYVRTYLERDLRNISAIRSLDTFERFLRLCAAWSGQLLNIAAIASDLGVDNKTVKVWLSLLQASYIVFLVEPHHENLRKRIRKSPKLYFYDVGLCAYLLGIREPAQIDVHPLRGALFETFVVAELVKLRLHRARDRDLFFFRDHVGNEVDVLIDQATRVIPVEIKASATFGPSLLDGLRYYGRLREVETSYLVYGGTDAFEVSGAHVVPFHRLHELMPAVRP
jgi:predicted AAA+ superfamily ATPase